MPDGRREEGMSARIPTPIGQMGAGGDWSSEVPADSCANNLNVPSLVSEMPGGSA